MSIAEHIHNLQLLISQDELTFQREPGSTHILAVSKGQSIGAIEQAYEAGLCDFGENYLQEAIEKINKLSHLPLTWHFIGSIQSNKTLAIANHFSWVHSVSRLKIAKQLHDHRLESQPPLNVCVQVNLDNEESKSGIRDDLVADLVNDMTTLSRLKLRGLMVIPKPRVNTEEQYQTFLRATHLLDKLNSQLNLKLDTLSMGMSDDLTAAIHAGSTMLRIGRSIFGKRNTQ